MLHLLSVIYNYVVVEKHDMLRGIADCSETMLAGLGSLVYL